MELGPTYVDVRPPSYARLMFKLVAIVDNEAVSIYDGVTRYPLGVTVYQEAQEDHCGGLYCFRTMEECLARDDQTLPRNCALLHAPRAIARVLAWSHGGQLPVAYGAKKAYSFIQAQALVPMPATWRSSSTSSTGQHSSSASVGSGTTFTSATGSSAAAALSSSSGVSSSSSSRSPSAGGMAGRVSLSTAERVSAGITGSTAAPQARYGVYSSRPPSGTTPARAALVRRQAATMALEQGVRDLELQLVRARGLLPSY